MKTYIGTKIIRAEPMTDNTFREEHGRPICEKDMDGYLVIYPDGYESWSPKSTFEIAYRELTEEEKVSIIK